MSPTSYHAAPPRVRKANYTGAAKTCQAFLCISFVVYNVRLNETGVLPDVLAAEKYPLHPIGIIPAWGVFTDSVFQTAFFDIKVV